MRFRCTWCPAAASASCAAPPPRLADLPPPGLGGAWRLCNQFIIESVLGKGTSVTIAR
jgi:hypothetical protein